MAMVDSEMLRRRVAALIDAGADLDVDMPFALDRLEVFRSWSDINVIHWSAWDPVAEGLTLSDLTLVIQMLTVLEREFQWSGGSVSSVIWLLRGLRQREPRVAALLADWVVLRTNNDYLPDGHHSSRRDWIVSRTPRVGLRAARDESARYYASNRERWERERTPVLVVCDTVCEAGARGHAQHH